MGFEETLVNLNVHGLVRAVLEILECEDDTLIELKTLGCNVLTHMMDTLPRSSDAVVPALPLLLTTMSSSFVGDILERIINLLEQLSRRHGREVLKSGAISVSLSLRVWHVRGFLVMISFSLSSPIEESDVCYYVNKHFRR